MKGYGQTKNYILKLWHWWFIICHNPKVIKFLTRLHLEHKFKYSNTAFVTHRVNFVIIASISNWCDISFITVPYTQIWDSLFWALLEILNVNFRIILRSCLYDKWYGIIKTEPEDISPPFVCISFQMGQDNKKWWDNCPRILLNNFFRAR